MDNDVIDIFISHSSKDVELVKELINIIRKAFNLKAKSIRCTSVEGYKLKIGADTNSILRKEVKESKVFIGVITRNSLDSLYTIFEFGARWGTERPFLPIVCDGKGTDLLKSPLKEINAANANNESSILQFLEDLKEYLNLDMEKVSSYNEDVSSFVKFILSEYPYNDVLKKNDKSNFQDIKLDRSNLEIPYKSVRYIHANGIEVDKCDIKIEDDYYADASINNGKIEIMGKKVGDTKLIVSYDDNKAVCQLRITPMNNFCGNPILQFGMSYSEIKDMCHIVYKEDKTGFTCKEGDILHHYLFENDKLVLVVSCVNPQKSSSHLLEVFNSMNERYKNMSNSNNIYWYQQPVEQFYVASIEGKSQKTWFFFYSASEDLIKKNIAQFYP